MKYLLNHQRKRFWLYTFCVCLSCICEICLAFIMSSCIDLALQQKIDLFWRYGIRFIAFILAYMLIDYSTQRTRHRLLQKAQTFLRDDTLSNILLLDSDTFHKKNTGEWVSTLTNDVEVIGQSYFSIILDFIPQTISFVSCTALLCYLSWPLAMFVVMFTLLQMLIPKILAPRISDAKEAQSNAASSFTVSASEHFQGYSLLHGLNLTKHSCDALSRSNALWEKAKFRVKHMTMIANTLSYGCGNVVYIGLYFIGAILVAKGHMSLGTMVAITQLSVYIMGPLQTFSGEVAEIISTKRILQKMPQPIPSNTGVVEKKDIPSETIQNIVFDNVSFTYDNTPIISNTNFIFERGKKYILSGPSGSGKTTIANLLCGNIEPQQGTVYFNHYPLSEITPNSVIKTISICSQNTFIFNDTLRNNITLFESRYTDAQVQDAIHHVGLDNVLNRFAHGLDEVLGQSGNTLSGGERQRIALARMELLNTPFIILDESFANLDTQSTKRILSDLTKQREKTVIYIGHQLPEEITSLFDEVIEIRDKQLVSMAGL